MTGPVDEFELHAFVDGELDEQRRREVEAYLANHPEAAARVADYQRLSQELHASFDGLLEVPVPERLTAPLRADRNNVGQAWRHWARVATIAGLMLSSGAIGWWAGKGQPAHQTVVVSPLAQQLAQPARVSYQVFTPEVLHPVEVDHTQEQHLAAWLSKRLGQPLNVPDLNSLGYGLVGGRLLAADSGAAALFMYENPQGNRLTLYIKAVDSHPQPSAFQHQQENGIGTFYWVDGPLGYALSGRLEKPRLLDAAGQVYRQLNL